MTPHQFAAAVGANPKWVQNAGRLLHRRFRRTPDEARWLRLVRVLQHNLGVTLHSAAELATRALAAPRSDTVTLARAADESAQMVIDRPRFESSFAAALAAARAFEGPKQRGRGQWTTPRRGRSALRAAEAYGVDLSLLRSSLALTPDQRLRRLDENAAFVRALRRA